MKRGSESIIKAKNYAFRLLSYRERSRREISDRLAGKGFSSGVCGMVIAELEELGLIDDRRFAGDFARSRIRYRPSGLALIRSELSSKGVTRDIVDEVVSDIADSYDEYETAYRIANDKVRRSGKTDALKSKRRLHDYLSRRRFKKDIIYKILNEIFDV